MTGPIAPRGSANRMSISRLALNANQVGVVMFPRLPVYVRGSGNAVAQDDGESHGDTVIEISEYAPVL